MSDKTKVNISIINTLQKTLQVIIYIQFTRSRSSYSVDLMAFPPGE